MRRMIPENQQVYLKTLMEKQAFLSAVTATGDVDTATMIFDSDGLSYFHVSGNATTATSGSESIEINGIPQGLRSAIEYPATNNLGTTGYVSANVSGSKLTIVFNAGTAGRTIYFSVLLSTKTKDL